MDETTPKKPWWRKKRWRAAAVFALAFPIVYPLGVGPLAYCFARGWLPAGAYQPLSHPARDLVRETPFGGAYVEYLHRWMIAGYRDHPGLEVHEVRRADGTIGVRIRPRFKRPTP